MAPTTSLANARVIRGAVRGGSPEAVKLESFFTCLPTRHASAEQAATHKAFEGNALGEEHHS